MSHTRAVLAGTALVLFWTGADARAELIQWSYSWSRSPTEVHSSNHNGAGFVSLTEGGSAASVMGNSDLVATNMQTHSSATPTDPDVFTNKPYALTLSLSDQDSQKNGVLTFQGEFNGTLTATSANLQNSFLGQTTQQLVLGDHLYTVTIGPFSPPGPPGSVNSGGIAARAEVTVSTIFHLPEPSSGVLAALGTGLALLLRRRPRWRISGRSGSPPERSS